MRKRLELVGQKFGRLTVIKFNNIRKVGRLELSHSYFACKCECGNRKIICGSELKRGNTKSCGCFRKEKSKLKWSTHRMSRTRFYKIWFGIKQRCLKRNNKDYKNYGGRGIKICDSWIKFENFRDDMYETYLKHIEKFGNKNTSIDRKNNDGNYEPNNSRWATSKEQQNNKRKK